MGLRQLLSGSDADAKYDALPGSMGGKILNADLAREISPRYRTREDRLKFTHATYLPASEYVYQRYVRAVREGYKLVVLLAGGAASGKTTSLSTLLENDDISVIFDSNCASFVKAEKMIDDAIAANCAVLCIYMHRNFKAAVEAMIERAERDGRCIPLKSDNGQDLPTLHWRVQRAFLQLAHRFRGNKSVGFVCMRNGWSPESREKPRMIAMSSLDEGGKRSYSSTEELYAIQEDVLSQLRDSISTDVRRAIGAGEPSEAA